MVEMTRNEINLEIKEILDFGNRNCQRTGDILASLTNKLVYFHCGNSSCKGISDANIPKRMLMQMCAFRIPNNFFNQIVDYLDS